MRSGGGGRGGGINVNKRNLHMPFGFVDSLCFIYQENILWLSFEANSFEKITRFPTAKHNAFRRLDVTIRTDGKVRISSGVSRNTEKRRVPKFARCGGT